MNRIASQRGMALIGVLVLSALLLSLAVALAVVVGSDTQLRGAFASGITGFYAAESGLNEGMGEYRNIFLDYNVPEGSDFAPRTSTIGDREVTYQLSERPGNPQSIVIPSGEVFAGLNAIQYRYIVNSKAVDVTGDVEASVGAEFLVGYIPLFQFVAFYENDLEILPGPDMVLNGRVHTNGDLYLNSNNSLTIADNPAQGIFTVQVSAGGEIHRGRKNVNECYGTVTVDKLEDVVAPFANLDPKVIPCSGGSNPVPVSTLVQWKGSLIGNIGNIAVPEPDIIEKGTGVYWEKADLRIVLKLNQPDFLPNPLGGNGPTLPHAIEVQTVGGSRDATKTAALHTFMASAAWNNGTIPGQGPSSYPGTMPIFYTDVPQCGCGPGNAACPNATATCYVPMFPADQDPSNGGAGVGANQRVYSAFMDSNPVPLALTNRFDLDYRRGGFYNRREQTWMLLLNINVRDLILWNQQNGEPFFATNDASEGGLVIFASVEGPLSGGEIKNHYGVRVFGSANLPLPGGIGVSADPTGVTVVSDQAIYVLGDFNRGQLQPGDLPRQPASLVGDSVNILSQRYWRPENFAGCPLGACCTGNLCRDGQSVDGLNQVSRDAQNTWINAAFLGGVDTTPDGFVDQYNGGLENYPRFHEDWSGVSLTYQGSFVSLGEPVHADGPWCGTGGSNLSGCNIYNAPGRLWNFDPAFNNAANLPPLTPRFVYVQQVLFTEDFK